MVLAESILGNENNIFREIDTVYRLYLESKKIKQTSEYKKKKRKRLTDIENKLVVTSGVRKERGRGLKGTNYYV